MINKNQKLILAPYVAAGLQQGKLYFGFGSMQRVYSNKNEYLPILEIASLWKKAKSKVEILESVKNISSFDEISKAEIAIEILENGGFLCDFESYSTRSERFARPWLYYNLNSASPDEVQKKLGRSHVVVLGCGGIGNIVATTLATGGVGALTLVDADVVELSNLTRQFCFTESDIGKSKVDLLKSAILARNSSCNVSCMNLEVTGPSDLDLLPQCDLIVVSADSPSSIINWVNRYSIENQTPYLNIGYVVDIAVWGPFVIPGKTGCWSCQSIVATEDDEDELVNTLISSINGGSGAVSIGPINLLSAGGAMLDIFRFLGGFGKIESANCRIGVWTHELKIERQNCSLNPECSVCGKLTDVT